MEESGEFVPTDIIQSDKAANQGLENSQNKASVPVYKASAPEYLK